MFNSTATNHAARRCSQRGISETALQAIIALGTEVEGGYLVTKKAALERARSLRREADMIEHVAGRRIVIQGDHLITAYFATKPKQQRLLRSIEQRNLEA